jgi:ATP-dependent Clp protease, protease subunit
VLAGVRQQEGVIMIDENEVRMDLLRLPEPILGITGEINLGAYHSVMKSLAFLTSRGSPAVKLVLDSYGGEVTPGLDIYDAIRLYKGDVDGLVHRGAASMAAVILQGCKVRRCARHASILIHYVSRERVALDVLRRKNEREKMIAALEKRQKRIDLILAERTGKAVTIIRKVCRKNDWMTSEESLAFGLIDEIV